MAIERILTCRLDDDDFKKLDEFADALGASRTQAIRYLIRIPKEVRDIQDEDNGVIVLSLSDLSQLIQQTRRHGYHLNQIARALNTLVLLRREGRPAQPEEDWILRRLLEKEYDIEAQYNELFELANAMNDKAWIIQFGAPRKKPQARRNRNN